MAKINDIVVLSFVISSVEIDLLTYKKYDSGSNYDTCKIMILSINALKVFRYAFKLFMYGIHNYYMYKIHEKFESIYEQFKSIYAKDHNLARVIIRATNLIKFH